MASNPDTSATNANGVGKFGAPPNGFTIMECGTDACIIRHSRTGMGCLNIFLGAWLGGWTVGCLFLVLAYLNGGKMENGDPMPFWFVGVFWTAEAVVACILIYLLFCRKTFRIESDALTIETNVLRIRWHKTISSQTIRRFIQVKDGGEGDDSFPSWGLKVEAARTLTILRRLPYDHSLWLGQVLANWAGVEFLKCLNPDSQDGSRTNG